MTTLRWIGLALVVIGIGGFFTVADDLRHTGELIGVGCILVLGLLAYLGSFWNRTRTSHRARHTRGMPGA